MRHKIHFLSLIVVLVLGACQFNKNTNPQQPGEDTIAIVIDDERNADLWAYLYTHEFVSDSLTLNFSGDKGYVNDVRIVDALSVSDNDDQAAALVGVNPHDGKVIKLAVIRDGINNAVVDLTDQNHVVFYLEKEQE
jgi:hypothetical protein